MARPRGLKLGGLVEGIRENVLAKEFFGSVEVDRGQVGWPQVPLLVGDGEFDITEIDITESAITNFQESDITESDITEKGNGYNGI